jgi:hypothetical protein
LTRGPVARTRAELAARAAWWDRRAWPVVVLGVDPGNSVAGAGLSVPRTTGPDLLWARNVDPFTREIERVFDDALEVADDLGYDLVVAIETWGRGGPMGLEAWIGLGAAKGYWKRETLLRCAEDNTGRLVKSRCLLDVNMRTWRSFMHDEHGTKVPHPTKPGQFKHVPYDEEGWKKAATRMLADLCPTVRVDGADAAEAGLVALYAHRSDELGKKLPKTLLRDHGFAAA